MFIVWSYSSSYGVKTTQQLLSRLPELNKQDQASRATVLCEILFTMTFRCSTLRDHASYRIGIRFEVAPNPAPRHHRAKEVTEWGLASYGVQ